MTPLLVGVREATTILGLGRDSVYELVRTRRLRAVRVNRRVLIPRTELVAFVEREAGDATPAQERALDASAPRLD